MKIKPSKVLNSKNPSVPKVIITFKQIEAKCQAFIDEGVSDRMAYSTIGNYLYEVIDISELPRQVYLFDADDEFISHYTKDDLNHGCYWVYYGKTKPSF